jgi:hypothetical protein
MPWLYESIELTATAQSSDWEYTAWLDDFKVRMRLELAAPHRQKTLKFSVQAPRTRCR